MIGQTNKQTNRDYNFAYIEDVVIIYNFEYYLVFIK